MGIYGKAGELVDNLNQALARGEPMIVLGPQLMEAGMGLLGRVTVLVEAAERSLDRTDGTLRHVDRLAVLAERYLDSAHHNAQLERRRLELEIERLERERAVPR